MIGEGNIVGTDSTRTTGRRGRRHIRNRVARRKETENELIVRKRRGWERSKTNRNGTVNNS